MADNKTTNNSCPSLSSYNPLPREPHQSRSSRPGDRFGASRGTAHMRERERSRSPDRGDVPPTSSKPQVASRWAKCTPHKLDFGNERDWLHHIVKHHHHCPYCFDLQTNKQILIMHMNEKHLGDETNLCFMCDLQSSNAESACIHSNTHERRVQARYAHMKHCDVCKQRFTNNASILAACVNEEYRSLDLIRRDALTRPGSSTHADISRRLIQPSFFTNLHTKCPSTTSETTNPLPVTFPLDPQNMGKRRGAVSGVDLAQCYISETDFDSSTSDFEAAFADLSFYDHQLSDAAITASLAALGL